MKCVRIIGVLLSILCLPAMLAAQDGGWAEQITSLHEVLNTIYEDMKPSFEDLVGVASAIAGFAAMWCIASKVWGHIARAEPIDFYPLFRPFVIGFCIFNFSMVMDLMQGILAPVVLHTQQMVNDSDAAIAALLAKKEQAAKESDVWQMYIGPEGSGDSDKWYKYTHPEDPNRNKESWVDYIGNEMKFAMDKAGYKFRHAIKEVISEILQLLFAAVALCINTLRTFNLIILAIIGPLVFGLSVFDGFHHTLKQWVARYVNIFLWLPVANIFGSLIGRIQEQMLQIDIGQIQEQGDTFFSATDAGYLIFLLIGIVGYTTVPSIANYIMWAGGSALNSKVGGMAGAVAMTTGGAAVNTAGATVNRVGQGVGNLAGAAGNIMKGYQSGGNNPGSMAGRAGRAYGQMSGYMKNKFGRKNQ